MQHFPQTCETKNHGKCPPAMCVFKPLPNPPGSPHRSPRNRSLDAKRAVSSVVKVTKPVEVQTNGSPADPNLRGRPKPPPPNATWKPQELGDEIGDLRPAMIGVSWWLIIPKNKAAYFFGQTWHCNGGVPLDSHSTTGDLGFVAKKIIGQFMFP